MKLLVDATPLHAGGGVQVALAFLDQLCRSSTEFVVALPQPLEAALPPSVRESLEGRIHFLSKSSLLDKLIAGARLSRIERDFAPDATFTVFGPAYFHAKSPHLVGFALGNLLYPRSDMPDRSVRTQILDALRIRLFRRADHLVAETHTVRDLLIKRLKLNPDKVSVIGNSVNPILAQFPPTPLPEEAPVRILVPSAYYPHKNLEVVPEVAHAMRQMGCADVRFELTLPHESTDWHRIAARAAALGVATNVTSLGVLRIDKLAAAYQNARLIFLPTIRESSTAVYPESFYFRRPLVTSDMPFARELCGDAARFAPPNDPRAAASILLSLLDNPQSSAALIDAGRRQLDRQYPTADQKFAAQMTLLEQVATARRPGA